MKKVLKISLGILFLILLIGTFVFLWNKTRPVKEVYAIVKPHIDTLEKRAVATGKVEPRDEVLIKPQISGIVSEVYKQAGEPVRQGEVIAKVKVIPDMATLNAAESARQRGPDQPGSDQTGIRTRQRDCSTPAWSPRRSSRRTKRNTPKPKRSCRTRRTTSKSYRTALPSGMRN